MNFILHKFYLSKPNLYKPFHAYHLGWISAGTLTSKHTSLTPNTWRVLPSFCWRLLVPADHSLGQGTFKTARADPTFCGYPLHPAISNGLRADCPTTAHTLQPWTGLAGLSTLEFTKREVGIIPSAHFHCQTPGHAYQIYPRKSSTRDSLVNCTQWANV